MNQYEPKPEHKFTFGLWTVGNTGRDSFGDPVREQLSPVEIVHLLAGVGLSPSTPGRARETASLLTSRWRSRRLAWSYPWRRPICSPIPSFAMARSPTATPRSALTRCRRRCAGAQLGAKVYVFWGGREGVESDAGKNPLDAMNWFREALNYLCEYNIDQGYGMKFALEAKPNEPRADLYLPTTGAMLAFIETLEHSEMVGVNPEVAHEHMAGLNYMHAIAQAWDAGKLFHLDLNDQNGARYDQDLRFGSHSIKQAFFLVKFLEDVGYEGSRHFDAHAYRTADLNDVKAFARGCIRFVRRVTRCRSTSESTHLKRPDN